MATIPRSQWSEAYRKRVERAEAKGLSRQQARGHRAKEHVQRKQQKAYSAIAPGSLTPSQRGQITKFMDRLPANVNTPEAKQKLIMETEAKGFAWFQKLREGRNELIKGAKNRPKGSGVLEVLYDILDIPYYLDFTLYYRDGK